MTPLLLSPNIESMFEVAFGGGGGALFLDAIA